MDFFLGGGGSKNILQYYNYRFYIELYIDVSINKKIDRMRHFWTLLIPRENKIIRENIIRYIEMSKNHHHDCNNLKQMIYLSKEINFL